MVAYQRSSPQAPQDGCQSESCPCHHRAFPRPRPLRWGAACEQATELPPAHTFVRTYSGEEPGALILHYACCTAAGFASKDWQGLGYLDEDDGRLTIKGRVACELTSTADELILTEDQDGTVQKPVEEEAPKKKKISKKKLARQRLQQGAGGMDML